MVPWSLLQAMSRVDLDTTRCSGTSILSIIVTLLVTN